MATHANILRLNVLLSTVTTAQPLPTHRRTVDASGRNIKFLRGVSNADGFKDHPEIVTLLNMKDSQLLAKS